MSREKYNFFEKNYYHDHGIHVDFVGNPLLDQVHTDITPDVFRTRNNISGDAKVIGIMPGSRKQEILMLLPVYLQTARMLNDAIQNCVFLLPLASTLTEAYLHEHGAMASGLDVRIIKDKRYEAMASCDAAMAASGTLTFLIACFMILMSSSLKHLSSNENREKRRNDKDANAVRYASDDIFEA